MQDREGRMIGVQEYLELSLRPQEGFPNIVGEKNQIR